MSGLFEKDLRMIMQRKKVFIIFVLLAVFIGYSQVSPEFVLGYIPMLTIIVIVGTISYDEYDNGYRFLMTLPIDAKMYVLEKYIFFIAGTITSWVDDDRMRLLPGEKPQMKKVRFRTLGCYPLTGGVESDAETLDEIIEETLSAVESERTSRVIDHEEAGSMERRKKEGYF